MNVVIILSLIIVSTAALSLKTNIDSELKVFPLTLTLPQENLIKLIMDASTSYIPLFEHHATSDYQLSFVDLFTIIDAKRFSDDVLNSAIRRLDVNFHDFLNVFVLYDVDYVTVKLLGLNLRRICLNFLSLVGEPRRARIARVLVVLGFDEMEFTNTVLYGEEEEMYDVLARGNYSQESISEINAIVNVKHLRTWSVLSGIHRNSTKSFLQRLELVVGTDFVSFMRNLAISDSHLTKFLALFISDMQDLAAKPAYKAFHRILREQQEHQVWGTWDGRAGSLITAANSAVVEFYSIGHEYLTLGTVANKTQIVLRPEYIHKARNGVAVIKLPKYKLDGIDSIAIRQDVVNSCYCYTNWGINEIPKQLVSVGTSTNGRLVIPQLMNTTDFVIGSPLICDNKLFGVVTERMSTAAVFGIYDSSGLAKDVTTIPDYRLELFKRDREDGNSRVSLMHRILDVFFTILKGFFSTADRCICK